MTEARESGLLLPSLADRLNDAIASTHARDETPMTDGALASEASKGHAGRISETEVKQLRSGELPDAPTDTLTSLAETIGVPADYFTSTDAKYVEAVSGDLAKLRFLRDVTAPPRKA